MRGKALAVKGDLAIRQCVAQALDECCERRVVRNSGPIQVAEIPEAVKAQRERLEGHGIQGVNDVVGIRYGDYMAICVEKAWTMTMGIGGTMQHTLERVIINAE